MLTKIETAAEFEMLPSAIKHIIRDGKGKVSKAEKSWSLQNAVVVAINEKWISPQLATEFLVFNNAYGKRGKELLKQFG